MWEVEPTLYWRVKKNGKWTWVRARTTAVITAEHTVVEVAEPPVYTLQRTAEVNESEK